MDQDLGSRTVRVAASLLGGPRRLAAHLQVPPADVLAWLSGVADPPQSVFLRSLDVILKDLERREP